MRFGLRISVDVVDRVADTSGPDCSWQKILTCRFVRIRQSEDGMD